MDDESRDDLDFLNSILIKIIFLLFFVFCCGSNISAKVQILWCRESLETYNLAE